MEKLKELFRIEMLMLGGGGVLNWSFIQAGMCDEVSVVIAAAADGSQDTPSLFGACKGLSSDQAIRFELQSAEVKNSGSVWLRYKVCPENGDMELITSNQKHRLKAALNPKTGIKLMKIVAVGEG